MGHDRQHDLLHSLVAEAEGWQWSPTLHAVANGQDVPSGTWDREERIVFLIQRLLNLGLAGAVGGASESSPEGGR